MNDDHRKNDRKSDRDRDRDRAAEKETRNDGEHDGIRRAPTEDSLSDLDRRLLSLSAEDVGGHDERRSAFDQMVDSLQQQIIEEERKIYSEKVIQEFNHPYKIWRMEDADARARVTGSCNDTMEFYLRIDEAGEAPFISEVSFMTDGCGSSIAAGSMLSRLVEKESLDAAAAVTKDTLLEALDGLPPENVHCAGLAVQTLRTAINDYRERE